MEKPKTPPWIKQLREKELLEFLNSDLPPVREFANWMMEPDRVIALQLEIERLVTDNMRLRTIMIEAHDEIVEHWHSHCDESGAGPVSLIRGLRTGQGYYPGHLSRIRAKVTLGGDEAQEEESTSDSFSEL